MALQLWETFKESITVYTGLSPATIFTVVAIAFAVYYTISSFFGSSNHGQLLSGSREFDEKMDPLPPPVHLGEVTEEELKLYDGSDSKKPLLMAIKGQIYDVSQSRIFYGPGGPYHMFAGKDASRALAKMSFEEKDLNGDLSGLGVFEMEALQDWEYKFMGKYEKVGTVKTTVPITDAAENVEAETETEAEATNVVPVTDAAENVEAETETETETEAKATNVVEEKPPEVFDSTKVVEISESKPEVDKE